MTEDKWFENTNNLPITSIVQLEGQYRTDSLITEYYENIQKAIEEEDVADSLDELDSDYYKLKEDIAKLLFNFIKKNIHDFE